MNAIPDRAVLRQALRRDLAAFVHRSFQVVSPGSAYRHNWHVDALAWHLRECFHRRIRRLVVTMPPRNLKSICASVAFPARALGRDPALRVIAASYSQELAAKHARDCRAVMQSPWYREAFPRTRLDPAKNAEAEFETTARGGRLSTSVGGTLTGRGGDVIVDDPMKPAEAMSEAKRAAVREWYDGTLYSRLDDRARGVIVLVMQRLHLDDLVGHALGKEAWVHLDLPAIAEAPQRVRVADGLWHERAAGDVLHPGREPLDELEKLRATLGSHAFAAQYQQRPVPADGALVKWRWFRAHAGPLLGRVAGDQVVQSWDTANKAGERNDYSVCATWLVRGEAFHLLDLHRASGWSSPTSSAAWWRSAASTRPRRC